ncbi:MAG: fibronectin type III domain-containing protein [Bacteroidota bacterium]
MQRVIRKGLLLALSTLLFAVCVLPQTGAAVDQVTVNVISVLNDTSSRPLGINTDYWMDDPGLRAPGARALTAALTDMRVKFMRYPGGEKADGYLWSTPPFTAPNPRLARTSSQDWPANDAAYWTPPGDPNGTWSRPVYDFDEFMSDCRAVGAEPIIVVAMDGIYKPAYPGGTSLTYQQALDTAVAWVRYANITRGYNIKYWTIGNETWNPGYMGSDPGATQYGIDAAVFAQQMKAVDPTIKVGINGDTTSWFDSALANCKEYIDFLDVHGYPAWSFRDYSSYARGDVNPQQYVDPAQASIDKLPEPHKSRIFITYTETSSATFGIRGSWTANDLGHALVNTDIFGRLLNDGRVRFALYWNTRWIDNNTNSIPHEYDALDKYNNLTATGLSMALLGQNLLDKMVSATSSSTMIIPYATHSPGAGKLNVILINKDTVSHTVAVTLQNYASVSSGNKWVLKSDDGLGSNDLTPIYAQDGTVPVNGNQFNVTLDPVSIAVIQLNAGGDLEPPTAPTNLAAAAVSASQIDLSWTAATDNICVTGYKVFRNGVEVGATSSVTYHDSGLQPNTTYTYYVKAFDAAGNVSAASNTAQETTQAQTPDTEPPTAPTNLVASAINYNQVNLTWTASTDNVGVTGYQIFRNGAQVGTSGTASYADTGLSPNTTYSYYVKAYDAASNVSPASNTAQATTPPAPGNTMHVADIWTCDSAGNPKTTFSAGEYVYWKVKIVDAGGNPVAGASVVTHAAKADGNSYGDFTNTTGPDGIASFNKKSNNSDPRGTCSITVTNVTLGGWTYDPGTNVKTTTNFTLQ